MKTQSIKAGVYGASGYAGQDLVELLCHHPHVELTFATSNNSANAPIPGTNRRYVAHDDAPLAGNDVVFLSLPHMTASDVAVQALAQGVKVIDLSADMRLDTPERYHAWYQVEHPHPELLPTPYGLPEINRANLHGVARVAVPGCYPTTTLLGVYPLLMAGVLSDVAPLIVDAKSGITGAGRTPQLQFHFPEMFGNFAPYKPGRVHRHVGEIEQELQRRGYGGQVVFVPHLLPVDRGLMASIYATLSHPCTEAQVREWYEQTYATEPLVQVLPVGELATLHHAVRKNNCTISVTHIYDHLIHITSVTDNLRKGAASQAVQCFNLMFGLEETTGLL